MADDEEWTPPAYSQQELEWMAQVQLMNQLTTHVALYGERSLLQVLEKVSQDRTNAKAQSGHGFQHMCSVATVQLVLPVGRAVFGGGTPASPSKG